MKDLVNFVATDFLQPFNFTIKGSRLAIERIVCRFMDPYIYCSFIHTGHLLSWMKLAPVIQDDNLQNLSLVAARTFENHADWTPVNLEVSDKFLAVEAISTENGQSKYPKILVYNVTGSQYIWYSISLQECAVTTIEVLSYVLVTTFDQNKGNRSTIIVANRRDNSNLLMYYETRPMVMSIDSYLSKDTIQEYSLLISNSSQVPLSTLLTYDDEAVVWSNVRIFTTVFCGVLVIIGVGIWIFNRSTNDNLLQVDSSAAN